MSKPLKPYADPAAYQKALEARFTKAVADYSSHVLSHDNYNKNNGGVSKLRQAVNEADTELFEFREQEAERRRLIAEFLPPADH